MERLSMPKGPWARTQIAHMLDTALLRYMLFYTFVLEILGNLITVKRIKEW